MRLVSLLFTLVLFLVALGLALSNTQATELRFFMTGDQVLLRLPLVILLLGFFIVGVAVGMSTGLPAWLRQKREITRLRRQIRQLEAQSDDSPPAAPVVTEVFVTEVQPGSIAGAQPAPRRTMARIGSR